MARCLIDASITLAWLFDEGGRGLALDRQIEPLELVAPWLCRGEKGGWHLFLPEPKGS